jgi:hypothetical protein
MTCCPKRCTGQNIPGASSISPKGLPAAPSPAELAMCTVPSCNQPKPSHPCLQAPEVAAEGSPRTPFLALRLRLACPKVGIALDMRPSAAAGPGEEGVPYVGVMVQGIRCEVAPGGKRAHTSSRVLAGCASAWLGTAREGLGSPQTCEPSWCQTAVLRWDAGRVGESPREMAPPSRRGDGAAGVAGSRLHSPGARHASLPCHRL